MDAKLVIAQLRKKREHVVFLDEAKQKSVTFLRPPETEMRAMLAPHPDDPVKRVWKVEVDEVAKYVIAWNGITLADLLGAGLAAPDPVEFDADLWREVCSDSVEFVDKVAAAILDAVVEHITKREEARKNSSPA